MTEVTAKRTHPYDTEMWFIRPNFKTTSKPKPVSKPKPKPKPKPKTVSKPKTQKTSWTFKVGGEQIETRIGSPKLSSPSGGHVKPNQTMTFNKLVKSNGFEWGMLTNYRGQKEYVPIRPLSQK